MSKLKDGWIPKDEECPYWKECIIAYRGAKCDQPEKDRPRKCYPAQVFDLLQNPSRCQIKTVGEKNG